MHVSVLSGLESLDMAFRALFVSFRSNLVRVPGFGPARLFPAHRSMPSVPVFAGAGARSLVEISATADPIWGTSSWFVTLPRLLPFSQD